MVVRTAANEQLLTELLPELLPTVFSALSCPLQVIRRAARGC